MKRIMILLLVAMLILTGCGQTKYVYVKDTKAVTDVSRFVEIEWVKYKWKILVDKETRVMYAVSDGGYNRGNFTVLINADGTPLLYNGELPD